MTGPRPDNPSPGGGGDGGGDGGDDGDALWTHVTGDVTPLKNRPKAPKPAAKTEPAPESGAPPPKKPKAGPSRPLPPPKAPPPPAPPREPDLVHGAAPGLDKRTQTRLRRGQMEIEAKIDLHGHTQAEAHRALTAFLEGAQAAGRRAVLVVTGKGTRPGTGVIRDSVPRWLNEPKIRAMVRAFSHAAPRDGGEGALYVLLKRRK